MMASLEIRGSRRPVLSFGSTLENCTEEPEEAVVSKALMGQRLEEAVQAVAVAKEERVLSVFRADLAEEEELEAEVAMGELAAPADWAAAAVAGSNS